MAHHEQLSIGNRGWVRYMASSLNAALFLRYEDIDGSLRLVDIFIEALDGETLGTDLLREIRLGQIDAWVNSGSTAEMLRARLPIAGIDLRRPASVLSLSLGEHHDGSLVNEHWVHAMLWAQHATSGVPQAPLEPIERLLEVPDEELEAERLAAYELGTLAVPDGRPFGDDFYRSVADAYSALVRWTTKPAAVMADQTGVEAKRVHNWIKEARQRGFLPAGRRGKVG